MTPDYYTENADTVFGIYEGVNPGDLYRAYLPALSDKAGGRALDIGAGSGRDAAWLRDMGYTVSAAEPNDAMRSRAIARHGDGISWSAASLPGLYGIEVSKGGFDIVFCNGVFMHVRPEDRHAALAGINRLLANDGVLCLNFRAVTDADEGRGMFEIHADEMAAHARDLGMYFKVETTDDVLKRKQMSWWSCSLGKL
jgi:SAM-dependent methyltransferase|nr:class I SAM-dependent methyltransferase [Neorhizobium tomejilense]